MDAQNKLKIMLGELLLSQINLAAQLEAALEENKTLKAEKIKLEEKNGTDTSN